MVAASSSVQTCTIQLGLTVAGATGVGASLAQISSSRCGCHPSVRWVACRVHLACSCSTYVLLHATPVVCMRIHVHVSPWHSACCHIVVTLTNLNPPEPTRFNLKLISLALPLNSSSTQPVEPACMSATARRARTNRHTSIVNSNYSLGMSHPLT